MDKEYINLLSKFEEIENVTYSIPGSSFSSAFVPATAFEIRPDPFSGAFGKLWKLSRATVDDGLNFLLGLFRDGHNAVQVLVNEESHEHLRWARTTKGGMINESMLQPRGA